MSIRNTQIIMENEEVIFPMANITPVDCRDVDYMND